MTRVVVENGTDWLTPVATLLAVLIGGGITWFVQSKQTERRERGEAKAAARMVASDIAINASWFQDMAENDPRWFSFYDLTLPSWERHAAVLALHLAPDDWEAVSQSALEFAGFTNGMQRAVAPGGPHEGAHILRLTEKDLRAIRRMWTNATTAYNALAPLAGIPRESGLLHEGAKPME